MSIEVAVWRQPGFRWLWAGQTISVFGSQLTGLAIPVLAVQLLNANEWQMGLLNAADFAAFLIVGLPAGAWVDRWRKRQVMIRADIVRMAAIGLIPALWFAGALQMWHLIAIGATVGVATVFFDVAYQSFVPILLPSEAVGPGNSALETTNQIAHVGGPAAVGVLLNIVKAPVVLALDAVSFLASALTLSMVRDDEQPAPKHERQRLRTEIAEGVQFVWRQKLIRTIAFTTSTSNLFGTLMATLSPLFFLRDLGFAPATFGVTMSVGAVGGLLGALSATRLTKWIGEGRLIAVSAIGFGLANGLFIVPAYERRFAAGYVAVGMFLSSFSTLVYNITQVTARQRLCPPYLLGRMNASIRFFVWGVMPISALIAGWLGTVIGIVPTMWVGFVGGLAACGFVVFSPLARMRELPRLPASETMD